MCHTLFALNHATTTRHKQEVRANQKCRIVSFWTGWFLIEPSAMAVKEPSTISNTKRPLKALCARIQEAAWAWNGGVDFNL